jgi:sec-independent protein translocase protein TatA
VPSLGFGEILIILVLALVIFGPRRLPEIGRTVGRGLREFRRAASDFRSEIEADLEDEEDEPPRVSRPVDRAATPAEEHPGSEPRPPADDRSAD